MLNTSYYEPGFSRSAFMLRNMTVFNDLVVVRKRNCNWNRKSHNNGVLLALRVEIG